MPLDTGLPFFIPHDDENLIPYTEAVAMKYGWVWKIPVKGRYGCGYVFDSSYITKEEALAEAEEYFGMKLESPRTFKFDAGTYKDVYINNCLAIGLSAGFIEPLEATSIMVSCTNLISFLVDDGISNQSKDFVSAFNKECYARNHEVLQFLYMHYLTERSDSPFWKEFRNKTVMVEGLQEKLNKWAVTAPVYKDVINNALWGLPSILQVGFGTRVLNRNPFIEKAKNQLLDPLIDEEVENALLNQANTMKRCLTHTKFLTLLQNH
jgi:tryptophan halogenase